MTGREVQVPDIALPCMWHGRVLDSPYARIKSIDTSAATALGAVTFTFADVPHLKYNECIASTPPLTKIIKG